MRGASDLVCRDFRHPGPNVEWGATLGSIRIPTRGLKDVPAFWDMLSRRVGRIATMDITRVEYGTRVNNGAATEPKCIVGIPIERLPDQAYTGYSMRSGELLSCSWKNAANFAQTFTCLYNSRALQITDSVISKYA